MTLSFAALLAQKSALERQIQDARGVAKADAIARVRKLMAEYSLTAADIVQTQRSKAAEPSGTKVAPKYRHPASGVTWSGRGLKPTWLAAALEGEKA